MLVEARRDGAVMLQFIEEAFDEITPLVESRAERRWVNAMVERADVGGRTLGRDHSAQSVAVVAAISQQDALAGQRAEQVRGAPAVVRLSFGQLERNREAAGIDERMDFGRKPAAGTAHATASATFFSPLAAC